MKRNIIIDCDPGHDDAIEILLALKDDDANLLGITTVAGNQTVDKTTLDALKILSLAGEKNIDVAMGCPSPIIEKLSTAPDIHGVSGLDGANLPEPIRERDSRHAVDYIRDKLTEFKTATIVTTGPLTNIALLLTLYPEIKGNIDRIVWMGGSYSMGNITPDAEFNAYNDPEALKIVLDSNMDFTMITLDVTHKTLFFKEDIKKIEKLGTSVGKTVADLLNFFYKTYEDNFKLGGVPIHDACALVEALHPGFIKTQLLNVDVQISPGPSRGRTTVDFYSVTGKEKNTYVSTDIDVKKFKNYIFDTLGKYK